MSATLASLPPPGLALMFGWARVRFVLIFTFVLGSMVGLGWNSGYFSGLIRVMAIGFAAMIVFGIFEQWPKRLPSWLARWVLQLVAVPFVIPWVTFTIYVLSTPDGAPPFWDVKGRMEGFSMLTGLGMFLSPWIVLFALIRQKEALARRHALALDLAKSEFERQSLDARLSLLQAQVAPHFLFNTLANVQALVESGSPKASEVLQSLISYLRAAVPRLHDPVTTLGQELHLVRAYLDLMRMRMPDRLQYDVHADESALELRCPPMTLLTLVENAVRHGLDPSEEGGRIDIHVQRHGERCLVVVSDTGVGLQPTNRGLGTGLSTLRERLALNFGGEASLNVTAQLPKGVRAELEFPARQADA